MKLVCRPPQSRETIPLNLEMAFVFWKENLWRKMPVIWHVLLFPRLNYVQYCSGMCEFLRVLLAAVDEMTNNSLLNGDWLYFLYVVCTHLDPALLLTICFCATTTSDFNLKNRILIIHQKILSNNAQINTY
jgi:hypothetical protein